MEEAAEEAVEEAGEEAAEAVEEAAEAAEEEEAEVAVGHQVNNLWPLHNNHPRMGTGDS